MSEYEPFYNFIAILLLSFFSAVVVLAGAEWSARKIDEVQSRINAMETAVILLLAALALFLITRLTRSPG